MRIAVIAGDYHQYTDWCREHDVNPRGREAFYATAMSLRGRRDIDVVRTGSWWAREDVAEIEQYLRFIAATAALA